MKFIRIKNTSNPNEYGPYQLINVEQIIMVQKINWNGEWKYEIYFSNHAGSTLMIDRDDAEKVFAAIGMSL